MPNQEPYCGVLIQEIGDYYAENILVKIFIPICLIGMILNLLNVLVFTRKIMNSPPNQILAHLAFVDFLMLLSNAAQYWSMFIQPKSGFDRQQSYSLTIVFWYSDITTSTFQFISAFLTVQLAAWRYIAVVHPLKERYWCTKKITRNVVITGYVVCCVLYAIPEHFSFDIKASTINGKTYHKAKFDQHPIMTLIRDIVYVAAVKLLPSVVLVGLTSRIAITLLARKTRREKLTSAASTRSYMKNAKIRQQTNTSTAILLAVAALYFMTEFPRGMLWLLATINEDDWNTCYYSLVWIFGTITNINVSITFIVYYTLSLQFRTTFKSLFSRNPRTSISHQRHAPLASGDTVKTDSGWKTSEV
ncbi:sex peptide receptor-related protein 2-like [Planococcus citri]|uniref:sex peptide receptor-related protein 2-like n=1 Tax=Planococcus citri TaxID=170843 RepID=UPI0031F9C2B5